MFIARVVGMTAHGASRQTDLRCLNSQRFRRAAMRTRNVPAHDALAAHDALVPRLDRHGLRATAVRTGSIGAPDWLTALDALSCDHDFLRDRYSAHLPPGKFRPFASELAAAVPALTMGR